MAERSRDSARRRRTTAAPAASVRPSHRSPKVRHRRSAGVLIALAALGGLAGWHYTGVGAAFLVAAGHFALLLLLAALASSSFPLHSPSGSLRSVVRARVALTGPAERSLEVWVGSKSD